MEWAAPQGAKVISMSLGGGPTDGTDPMSQAVDKLSHVQRRRCSSSRPATRAPRQPSGARYGGRGADGRRVDQRRQLATFSSRGPRLGDAAVKPEIVAPGVGHRGRAVPAPTQVRGPVYTAMSGTSMATPHVAGAAAILAQRHPDWTGQQLKAALAATAVPSAAASADEQGLGQIDIPKALDPKVLPDTANLFFGDVSWSGPTAPAPITRNVAYRNNSTKSVTLDLTVDVQSPAKIKAAVTVSPARLTIPAGGTASATVTLDLAKTQPAKYSGVLTARSGGRRTGPGWRSPPGAGCIR